MLPINSQATADAMMGREWCDADLELLAPLGAPAQGDELCWAAKHLEGAQLDLAEFEEFFKVILRDAAIRDAEPGLPPAESGLVRVSGQG